MGKRKVIIYDDDEAVLNLLQTFFRGKGYDVLAFKRPVVCAVDEFCSQCPLEAPCANILLTDYIMPEMNGVELLMAQSRRKCRIPAADKAIISGFLDEIVLKKLTALGYKTFEKPFDLAQLEEWIEERRKAGG